jgi:hypothetical protein
MKIASFDIGLKNFAFCIEDIPSSIDPTNSVWLQGSITYMENYELCTKVYSFEKLLTFLTNRKHRWEGVDLFLIEQQMHINNKASKMAHQLEAYFKIVFPGSRTLYFSPKFKTKAFEEFGVPKTYAQRKKFTTNLVLKYLDERQDTISLQYLTSLKKRDDVCDAVCQLQAYKLICLKFPSTTIV